MPSLEDKKLEATDHLMLTRFEKLLKLLLSRYTDAQKQILHLREENKKLKTLLQADHPSEDHAIAVHNPSALKILSEADRKNLIDQINAYIKEIDYCLAYFDQV